MRRGRKLRFIYIPVAVFSGVGLWRSAGPLGLALGLLVAAVLIFIAEKQARDRAKDR
jgi:hypothetical protein